MWTVFGTQYRISVGYHASVVIIERPRTVRRAPPALEARLTAVTLRTPVIERIDPAPVHAGDTLVLTGRSLAFDTVTLRFQGVDIDLPAADVHATSLSVALPPSLRAGPNTVQAIGSIELPDGGGRRRFASSDVAAFVLAPTITTAIPAAGIAVARGANLTLGLAPAVAKEQRVSVLVGERAIARTVTETDPATLAVFRIPAAPFPTGTSLLRVVVDGRSRPSSWTRHPAAPPRASSSARRSRSRDGPRARLAIPRRGACSRGSAGTGRARWSIE